MIQISGFFSDALGLDAAARNAGAQAASGAAPVIQAELDTALAKAEAEMQRTILFGLFGVAVIAMVAVYVSKS